jgi:hypothetical protein
VYIFLGSFVVLALVVSIYYKREDIGVAKNQIFEEKNQKQMFHGNCSGTPFFKILHESQNT